MTPERRSEIEARHSKATKGPYKATEPINMEFKCRIAEYEFTCPPGSAQVRADESEHFQRSGTALIPYGILWHEDAEFLAHSWADIAELCKAVKELQADKARLHGVAQQLKEALDIADYAIHGPCCFGRPCDCGLLTSMERVKTALMAFDDYEKGNVNDETH